MIIFVDIDKTICNYTVTPIDYENLEHYSSMIPIYENIDKVNKLYDQDHTIVFWTARNCINYKNELYKLTLNQLKEWNVKFHELRFGKPFFDVLIDDRSINSITEWNEERIQKVFEENEK